MSEAALLPEQYIAQARSRVQPTHMYYRQPNGWITVEAATLIERAKFQDRGWTPLMDYPRFDMGHVWCADNQLATLFQFGGAKELPLDQIVSMGFHLNPPVALTCRQPITELHNHNRDCYRGSKPVHFPQLEGVTIPGPFPCRFCDRAPFPVEQARRNHEEVAHKDERASIRTGETLASSLVTGLRGEPEAAVATTSVAPMPYVCGFCGKGFKSPWQQGKHIKAEHKKPVEVNE